MTTYEKNLQARKNERIRIAKEGGDVQEYLRNERNAALTGAAKAETQSRDYQLAKSAETPMLDASVGNTPDFVAPSAQNRQLTNEEQALEIMGLLNPVDFSPEAVAERNPYGTPDKLTYVGRKIAGGAATTLRGIAIDVGYSAQATVPQQTAENAIAAYRAGAKFPEAEKAFQDYMASIPKNQRDAMEITGTLPAYEQFLGEYVQKNTETPELKKSVDWGEAYNAETAEQYADMDGTILGSVAEGVGGVAPIIGISSIPVVGKFLGKAAVFSAARGNAMQQALDNGASYEDADAYGTAVGSIELATEALFGGLGKIGKNLVGKGVVGKTVEKYITSRLANNPAAARAITRVINGLGEGAEEYLAEWGGWMADKATIQQDERTAEEVQGDAGYSFLVGTIMSGLLQAADLMSRGQSAQEAMETAAETETPMVDAVDLLTNPGRDPQKIPGTRSHAEYTLASPARKARFEQESGIKLTGTKTEQRNAILQYYRNAQAAPEPGAVTSDTQQTGNPLYDALTAKENAATGEPASSKEISDYVEYAISKSKYAPNPLLVDEEVPDLPIGSVSQELADKIMAEYGVDISGREHVLRDNDIRHMYNGHGPASKEADPLFAADIKMIPTVIAEANDVYYIPRPDGRAGLVYQYQYNGTTFYLESLVDGDDVLVNKQMIKVPTGTVPHIYGLQEEIARKSANSAPGAATPTQLRSGAGPQMYVQDVWNGALSEDNISQVGPVVNRGPYHPINEVGAASAQATYGRDPVHVPVTNFEGHLTSKTSSTIINSGLTPNGVAQSLTELLNKGEMSRIRFTDADAVADAKLAISEKGFAKALEEFRIDVANGQRGKGLMARGIELFNMAAQSGDIMTATDIAVDIVDSAREQAQAIQVLNLFNKATPEGRVYFAVKGMDKLISKMEKKYGDRAKGINVNEELLTDYYEAVKSGNEQAIKETWQEVQKDVAAQIPANWADKFRAWRYLAMLGNPKTHIRNVAGNVVFMPARYAKNVIGAGLEKISGTESRTKAVLNPLSAQDRQLMQLAWQDYAAAMDGTDTGRYDESTNDIDRMRQVLPGALDKVAKWNTEQMAKEDRWFSQPAYMDALAGWFKANNITPNQAADMMAGANAETFAKAREYAILEAKKATFQDVNAFSDAVSRFGRSSKGGRFLMDAVLPFKRTPANVLMRAAEYSPAYLMKGLKEVAMDVPSGKMSAAEAIDHLASGLTGTGIMGLGFLLAKMGLLRGSGGDDEKQAAFDKLQGKQDYSLTFGDTSFTIDWMAPSALPLFVGAELYELMTQGEGENATLEDYLSTLLGIADPILETSMLSGINDLIDSVGYSDRPMMDVIKNIIFNYLGSFLPTIGGQIERMGDENRQETYRYNESDFLSKSQYDVANLLNKIPGIDAPGQIDYVDAWGRTQENTNPLFNQLFNPSYVSAVRTSEVETELQRLYDRGQGNVFPKRRGQGEEISVLDEDGEFVKSRHLTAEEYEQFNRTKGQTSLRLISDLMETNFYRTARDSEKAKAIENIYAYANAIAMMEAEPTTKVDSWITKARDSSDPGKYIQLYSAAQNLEPWGDNKSVSTWQKVELVVGNTNTKQADEFIPLYMDGNYPTKYEMARERGYSPERFVEAYTAMNTIESDRDANGESLGNVRTKVIAHLVSLGWPEANAAEMYKLFRADTKDIESWKW